MLSLPALLIITVAGYVHVRGIDVTPHKPGWWLVYELDAGGDVEATAFVELCRRFQKNELSNARIADVADYCLSRQANRSIPWNRAWGSYIETARMNGKLSDERWGRYATGSFRVTMLELEMQRVGSSLPLQIRVERSRVTGSTFRAGVSWSDVSIDGIPIEAPKLKLFSTSNYRRGDVQEMAIYVAEISGAVTGSVPPGAREIRASLVLTIDDGDARHPTIGSYRYDVRAKCQFTPALASRAAMR